MTPRPPPRAQTRVSLRDEPARGHERQGLFSSDDERIYNPQTGRYEWSTDGHSCIVPVPS